jgi:hypothetical protein
MVFMSGPPSALALERRSAPARQAPNRGEFAVCPQPSSLKLNPGKLNPGKLNPEKLNPGESNPGINYYGINYYDGFDRIFSLRYAGAGD